MSIRYNELTIIAIESCATTCTQLLHCGHNYKYAKAHVCNGIPSYMCTHNDAQMSLIGRATDAHTYSSFTNSAVQVQLEVLEGGQPRHW